MGFRQTKHQVDTAQLLSKLLEGLPVQEVGVGQAGDRLHDFRRVQKRAEGERGVAFGFGAQADGSRH